jgi:hypothetical protein
MDHASAPRHQRGSQKRVPDRSHPKTLSVGVTLFVCFALLLTMPVVSWGHVDPPFTLSGTQNIQIESPASNLSSSALQPVVRDVPSSSLVVVLLLAVSLGLAWGMWRWRRIAALGLACILGVFTFAAAIHGVHHLLDYQGGNACPVYAVSQHVSCSPSEALPCFTPLLRIEATPAGDTSHTASFQGYALHPKRAPPFLLS